MITENDLLTFGRHIFTAIKRVPSDYLLSIAKHANALQPGLGEWIENNKSMLKSLRGKAMSNEGVNLNCGKYYYMSEEEANKYLKGIREYADKTEQKEKVPIRSYLCDKCGYWHITSQIKKF